MDTALSDLQRQIKRAQVVVVAGAGVSLAVTEGDPLASWTGLLESGLQRCVAHGKISQADADRVRAEIHSSHRVERLTSGEKIKNWLGNEFGRWLQDSVGRLQAKRPTVIRALEGIASLWLTTNYDGLIEEVTGLSAVTWREEDRFDEVIRGDDEKNGVLHLHGYFRDPESVIFGILSYQTILGAERAQTMLRGLLAMKRLLFVGFGEGIDDPNFKALRDWVTDVYNDSPLRHYRLVSESSFDQALSDHAGEPFEVLSYGRRDELIPFLLRLSGKEPMLVEKPRVAITMGDANGIGPEVVLKALRVDSPVRRLCIPIVIGSAEHLQTEARILQRVPPLRVIETPADATDEKYVWVIDVPNTYDFDRRMSRQANPQIGECSIEYTRTAIGYAQRGEVTAVVSGPVSKQACLMSGSDLRGHTELIAQILGAREHGTLYLSAQTAIATVTGHCRLQEVPALLTRQRIADTIVAAAKYFQTCRSDALMTIGVCSINPHAGEGGWLGDEDEHVVRPAIHDARARLAEFTIDGPIAADALFRPQIRPKYPLIIAMYHDQAKVALAAIDSNTFTAVFFGGGIVRTTVTHGTAFDIAGESGASSANMVSAIEQAVYLSPDGTKYIRTSPDLPASERYSIEVRLNRYTKEKNLLAERLFQLEEVHRYIEANDELCLLFGPGSTPVLVVKDFLARLRNLTPDLHSLHVVTDNLSVVEHIRTMGSDFNGRLSVFGGEWSRRQNSLGPGPSLALDAVLASYGAKISIISCFGIGISHDGTLLFAYTRAHKEVLSAIVKSHKAGDIPPSIHPLIVVATGHKLGKDSAHVFARGQDISDNTLLLLEVENRIEVARGRQEIDRLVASLLR